MIYFDNAATTYPKPDVVKEAIFWALDTLGNPGRSGHMAALEGARIVEQTRQALARLFGSDHPECFAFGYNATDALNTAIRATALPDSKVITTVLEHNSVLRPLHALARTRRLSVVHVPPGADGVVTARAIDRQITRDTSLVVVNHVSNVTGAVQPVAEIAQDCARRGVPILVDAAQSAGTQHIDLSSMPIDMMAFPGHKGLLGPQGTGALYVRPGMEIAPLKFGGTGSHSFDLQHPPEMPDRLEAGTANAHGLAGLLAGVLYIQSVGVDAIRRRETLLVNRLIKGLVNIPGCIIYSPANPMLRSGVLAFNIGQVDSIEIGQALADRGIAVRAGIHCAPLLHRYIGTQKQGAVRVSFSVFNQEEEVESFLRELNDIVRDL
ncbi:MAG: aminotransferase class V-fold PLP-dependent enzyme [Christensenellales bacterium]|jgi:cysteine desulfurase family protein